MSHNLWTTIQTNCKQKSILKNEAIWKHRTMYQSHNIKNDLKNEKMETNEMI
jgi:hypothetical protein